MGKRYVEVIAKFDINGKVIPLSIIWEDGRIFEVDKILDMRQAVSLKAGGTGYRYLVLIKGNRRYLFCEGQNLKNKHSLCKWFIEK